MTSTAIFPPVIDATMRSAFLTCPHYFFRKHCEGLTTGEAVSIDLHFGACFAKGLETVRRSYTAGNPQGLAICHGGEAILNAWAGYEFNPRTRNQENKSLDNCLLALNDYFRQWSLDTDPVRIHMRDGEPCIEFSGALPIRGTRHPDTGEPIVYAGRFDMIGDYEASVWGLDDKTGQISADNSKWSLRGQFTGYCWIAHEYGLPLNGFLVREVQPLTHSIKFNQTITPRPQWMIDRWLSTLRTEVDRMLNCWAVYKGREDWPEDDEIGYVAPFPQNLDSGCYAYNRPCEFTPLCTSEHPDRWLDTYTINRWNPLERSAR